MLRLAAFALVFGIVGQASARASGPTLTDFAPSSGMPGAQILLVGSGFTDANFVAFNGTSASFTVIADEYIIAVVPAGATSGPIIVMSPEGTAMSSTFTVLASVTVTGFSPTSGSPGTPVTITGTHLTGATNVAFDGVAATIGTNTDTQITTTVPSGATTGSISVTTPMGSASSQTSFTVLPALTVSSFAPGSAQPGKQVAIIGSGFTDVTGVTLNGTSVQFQILSDTYLLMTVPAGATSGPIVVSAGTSHAAGGTFTVIPPLPTISGFTPATGPEGKSVVVTGTGFTYVTAAAFNSDSVTFVINSDTQITTTVPTGATDGPISVTSPGGTATTGTAFVLSAPTVATAVAATSNPVKSTTVSMSVLGAYAGGESHLTYTWSATGPASVNFSVNGTNGSKMTTAAFTVAGTYTITATIASPSGKTVTSSLMVVVSQIPQSVSVSPAMQALAIGMTQSYTASATDQFGNPDAGAVYTWAVTGVGSVNSSGLYSSGSKPGSATVIASLGTVVGSASATVGDLPPSLGTITANPSPVTGTSAMLSVTSSYAGGGTMSYQWTTTSAPQGGSVVFTGGASGVAGSPVTATAAFTKAGTYTVRVTVTDANSGTASQTGTVVVAQTGTTVIVTPASASIAAASTQKFSAQEMDQFGNAMVTQPSFSWLVTSGGGSVDTTGLYTASGTVGTASVSATPSDGVAAGIANLTVTNSPPTVVNAAAANGTAGSATVSGTSVALSVLGSASAGENTLSYTWTASRSSAVTFSDNGDNSAKNMTATFTQAGPETFTVTIADTTGAMVTSTVSVTVTQTLTKITVTPATDTLAINASGILFTAVTADQFGNPLGTPPPLTWSNTGVGSVDSGGNYTVGATPGGATVTASSGSVSGSARVTVNDIAPTLSSITVTPSPVMGTTGTLSVVGSYTGAGNLTYAWSAPLTPSGAAVSFSGGTSGIPGSIVMTTATFSQPGTYTVQATVSDAAGATALKTVSVTVIPTPAISSFSPAGGPIGTSVTITGTNLSGATAVTFNGLAASAFAVVSATQITATVPPGATPGVIGVTTPGGTATTTISFTVFPAPSISGFSPAIGQIGAFVTITGTNLTGAVSVTFNGTPAVAFMVNSSNSITVTVPPGATTGAITVTALGGTVTSAANFTVIPPPAINNFSPTGGPVGISVTITGTNFANVSGVSFGQATTSAFTINSLNSITATVPPGATTSVIGVSTPGGPATSVGVFTVIPIPAINNYSPNSGAVGSTVTITGSNFADASGVMFGGVSATTFTVVSSTEIVAIVPVGAATGLISVMTPGGTANSPGTFQVIPAPSISSLSPGTGPAGSLVTIMGANFTGTSSVTFGGSLAVSYSVVSATEITATVPDGAVSGKLTVTTPGGTATSAGSFAVIPAPVILSFAPASGVIGALVTVTGTGLSGATSVSFGGVIATTFTVTSSTSLTAVVPTGAVSGVFTVATPGGIAISPMPFGVVPQPVIANVSPATGVVGTLVTITGTGFTGAASVSFGGISAPAFTVASSTTLTVTIPVGAVTSFITITTPGGTATSPTTFVVVPVPAINGYSPTTGTIGTSVTITGTALTGATSVTFGGTPSTTYSVVSDTKIVATVPTGANTGVLTVTTPGGTATSAGSFIVISPPQIGLFSPASGIIGTVVTIAGTNLAGAANVAFGGMLATNVTVVSATEIMATVPAGAVTGSLTLTTPGGSATSASPFTVIPLPTLTSFTPSSGVVGSAVTITGTSLTGATSVSFGGVPATTFTVTTGSSITAIVPAGAMTGPVSVVTPIATATSAAVFTVIAPPVITAFSPESGAIGDTIAITGMFLNGATSVTFSGVPAVIISDTASLITVSVPGGATTGAITIITAGGKAVSTAIFTLLTWSAVDVAAAPDGTAKVLADRSDGAATVWLFNSANAMVSSTAVFGPFVASQGIWAAKAIKTAADGTSRILWTRADGAMGVWTLAADGSVSTTGTTYGPYSDSGGFWSASDLAVATDGSERVLWRRTDGAAVVWTLSAAGVQTHVGTVYGPYGDGTAAWSAAAITGGSVGTSHVLWTRADGAAGVWTMSPLGIETSVGTVYGPYATAQGLWKAVGIGASADGIVHALWVRGDGAAGVWTMSAAGAQTNAGPIYGPYSNFAAHWIDTYSDQSRVLWMRSDRAIGLWTFDADDSESLIGSVYGPF